MKKQTLSMVVFFFFIYTLCFAGWVEPTDVPDIWNIYNFEVYPNTSPMAISSCSSIGTVIAWAEYDTPDVDIYATLWDGSKTLIDTITPGDMNSPGFGSCGYIWVADIEITSQSFYDGTRDCFYMAVLVYDMCTLCEDNNYLGRTETWVEVYKLWNSSGTLQSQSLGHFGQSTTCPTIVRETVIGGYSGSAAGNTKILDVAIEKADDSGNELVMLYFTYCYYEAWSDPYCYIYVKEVSTTVGGSTIQVYQWDETADTGMPPTKHCLEATFDDYSDQIWLLATRLSGSLETGTWYASILKMDSIGIDIEDTWINCKSNVETCRITADNNASSYSRIGFCWRSLSDYKIKAAVLTESGGVGSTINVTDNYYTYNPDITYLDSGYFAVVYKYDVDYDPWSSVHMTRILNGAPNEREKELLIASATLMSGINLTKQNVFPRIATNTGTSTGQFYLAWKGIDGSSNQKLVCKRTSSVPFRSSTYYSVIGKMIIPPDPEWVEWHSDMVDANSYYGANYRQCVIDVNTTGFGVGNQVYASDFKVNLYENTLDEKHADLRLLDDPTDPESGTSLPDLADSSDGTGWTDLIDVSVALNYWKKRPAGHDCFHVKLAPAYNPWDERIRIYLNYTNKKPSLYLYYIDWEP